MPKWDEITVTDKYKSLPPEARAQVKTEWFKANMLPEIESRESLRNMGVENVYDWFMQQPDDSGQGIITSTIGGAARGFGEIVPGAIQGAGALTGIDALEDAGKYVREGLEYVAPVNPLYQDSIPVKAAGVAGQVGSVLATAGAGGALGKALAAERIAAGATAAEQALAASQAISRGANTALYGSGGLQGAAQGAQTADQYGLTGLNRYGNILAGAATEIGTEMLPFGLGAETAAAKRLLGAAPRAGRFAGDVASEAGEEFTGQVANNAALAALAPAGIETPGLLDGAVEAGLYGGLGGGILGGVNIATGAYKSPATVAAQDLTAVAENTSPDVGLTVAAANATIAAADKADQESAFTDILAAMQRGEQAPIETPSDVESRLAAIQSGPSAFYQQLQRGITPQSTFVGQETPSDVEQRLSAIQNEPIATAPVGTPVSAIGTTENLEAGSGNDTILGIGDDGRTVLEEAQLEAPRQETPQDLAGGPEVVPDDEESSVTEAPRIAELARQEAAINAGAEKGADLGFAPIANLSKPSDLPTLKSDGKDGSIAENEQSVNAAAIKRLAEDLAFSGVGTIDGVRYAIQASPDGTFYVQKTTDGVREALALGQPDIETANQAALQIAFNEYQEASAVGAKEESATQPAKPKPAKSGKQAKASTSGMSVEESKAYLARPGQILGFDEPSFLDSQRQKGKIKPAKPLTPLAEKPTNATEGKPMSGDNGTPSNASTNNYRGETASWVIRNKETGEVIEETFDANKVRKLNTKKYEAVPIGDYLESLNKPQSTEKVEKPSATQEIVTRLNAASSRDEAREILSGVKDLLALKEVAKAMNYPTTGTKKDVVNRLVAAVGSRFDAAAIRDSGKVEEKATFRYEMRARPPSIGTHPKEGFVSHEEGGTRHGFLTYDRPLTEKEIYDYELKPVSVESNQPTSVESAKPTKSGGADKSISGEQDQRSERLASTSESDNRANGDVAEKPKKGDLVTVALGGREYPKTRIINVTNTTEGVRYQVDVFGPKFVAESSIIAIEKPVIKTAPKVAATPQLIRQIGDIAVKNKQPLDQGYIDSVGGNLPQGYVKQGDSYVYKPEAKAAKVKEATAKEGVMPKSEEKSPEKQAPSEKIKSKLVRFASGMSAIGDLEKGSVARAFHQNYGVGFDVGLLSKNAINSLANLILSLKTQVFIDSGAFSNFKKALKAPLTGKKVEPLDFDQILAKYDSIIEAIHQANEVEETDYPRPMLVMPDVIGNQAESLALIEKHKNWIAAEVSNDTSVPIIPIPLGGLSLSQAYNRILEILKSNTIGVEIDPNRIVVGIPSNAEAISRDDLAKFLRESNPPRIHFLGAAADRNINPLIDVVAQNSPDTQVTADASKVRSAILNGVAKGKTRQQAIFDALYQEDDPSVVLDALQPSEAAKAEKPSEKVAPLTPEYVAQVKSAQMQYIEPQNSDIRQRFESAAGKKLTADEIFDTAVAIANEIREKGGNLHIQDVLDSATDAQIKRNLKGTEEVKSGLISNIIDRFRPLPPKGDIFGRLARDAQRKPLSTQSERQRAINELTEDVKRQIGNDPAEIQRFNELLGLLKTNKSIPRIATALLEQADALVSEQPATMEEAFGQDMSELQVGDVVSWEDKDGKIRQGAILSRKKDVYQIADKTQETTVRLPRHELTLVNDANKESRTKALDSIIGTPTGVEMNAVSPMDGRESLALVHNSGDVPGVLNAFVGTSKEFLANKQNEKDFPELYAILKAGRVDEGNFAYGRAFVFTDGIGVNASDRENAAKLGVTPAVAAVRRVLVHESLVHRGIYGLPARLKMQILQWVKQNTTPEQLDALAAIYLQYENWRNNEAQMLGLCEELLAKTVDKMTKPPTSGPLARLVEILKDIWRWITGNTGEPTIKNLKDVVKLLKAGVETADSRLVNGGGIKMSQLRAQGFVTPEMDAEYMAAVEAGDVAKQQELVDKAAKAAGGVKVWHGGNIEGNVIDVDRRERGAVSERRQGTFFGSTSKEAAKTYPGKTNSLFFFLSNPFQISTPVMRPASWTGETVVKTSKGVVNRKSSLSIGEAIDRAKANEYDGVVYENIIDVGRNFAALTPPIASTVVVFNPNQIKSADPITRDNNGNVIPLSQRFNPAKADIRESRISYTNPLDAQLASASKRMRQMREKVGVQESPINDDARYLELAKDPENNQAELQRMVDAAAKKAGKLFGKWFHGQPSKKAFTIFNPSLGKSFGGWNRIGSWFTLDKTQAKEFAEHFDESGRLTSGTVYDSYLWIKNPLSVEGFDGLTALWSEYTGKDTNNATEADIEKFRNELRQRGFDGLVIANVEGDSLGGAAKSQTYALALDPSQIKSADAIVKDDNGKIVPLSQRFGASNDIRGVTPAQIRSEIRKAYDKAIQGSGSVQASLQQVYDIAKAAIPTLTEKQFGEQVQALYEDGSAFLVPTDRSSDMLAAGEKWGVYDVAGLPASYIGVMPSQETTKVYGTGSIFQGGRGRIYGPVGSQTSGESAASIPTGDNSERAQTLRRVVDEELWANYTPMQRKEALDAFAKSVWGNRMSNPRNPLSAFYNTVSLPEENGFAELSDKSSRNRPVIDVNLSVKQSHPILDETALEAHAFVYDMMQEEFIHTAQLFQTWNEWVASGSQKSIKSFTQDKYIGMLNDVVNQRSDPKAKAKIDAALLNSWNLYNPRNAKTYVEGVFAELQKDTRAIPTYMMELGRQLVQIGRQDFTTETGWTRFKETLIKWANEIRDALRSVLADVKGGTFGKLLKNEIDAIEGVISHLESGGGVMPAEIKASRVENTQVPKAIDSTKGFADAIDAIKTASPTIVESQARALKDHLPDDFIQQGVEPRVAVSIALIDRLLKSGIPAIELPSILNSPAFLDSLGISENADMQQYLAIEALNRINLAAADADNVTDRNALVRQADGAAKIWNLLGEFGGRSLGTRGWLMKHPRYAAMFVEQGILSNLTNQSENVTKANIVDPNAVVKGAEKASETAKEAATNQSDEDLVDSWMDAAEETLSPKAKGLFDRIREKLARIGYLMGLSAKTKQSVAGNLAARFAQEYKGITQEKIESELEKLRKEVEADLSAFADELLGKDAPQEAKTKVKKTAEKAAKREKKKKPTAEDKAKKKQERANAVAQRLIYRTEEVFRQGFKNEAKSKNADSILKAFRDQVKEPVSDAAFTARVKKLNVTEEVAARMLKTAARERGDQEQIKKNALLDSVEALKKIMYKLSGKLGIFQIDPTSWRKLFSTSNASQAQRKVEMQGAIKSDPAFSKLDEDEQKQLADLLDEAWQAKHDEVLKTEINRLTRTNKMSDKAKGAINEAIPEIIQMVNRGTFDNAELAKIVSAKFGFRDLTAEERGRLREITEKLQQDIPPWEHKRLANELRELLADVTNLNFAELAEAWWVSSVLSGPRTAFTIGLGFNSGGFEVIKNSLGTILLNPTNPNAWDASFKAIKGWLSSMPREAQRAIAYLKTGDVTLLDSSMSNDAALIDRAVKELGSVGVAAKLLKSKNPVARKAGQFMAFMQKLLQALDMFNGYTAKYAGMPLAYFQTQSVYDPKELDTIRNHALSRQQVLNSEFGGVEPTSFEDKARLSAWATDKMWKDIQRLGGLEENANYLAQQSNMTLSPTGVGGIFYHTILGVQASQKKKSADFVQKQKEELLNADGIEKQIAKFNLALGYMYQFAAHNLLASIGLKFIRFGGGKLNQTLSFIPLIGLTRLAEKTDSKQMHLANVAGAQAFGFLILGQALWVLSKIAEEPDDDERGWDIQGNWGNVSPERKQQLLAAGKREYTIFYKGVRYSYANWPISGMLSAIGSMADLIRYSPDQWNEKSVANRLASGVWAAAASVGDSAALSQFSELLGTSMASRDPIEASMGKFNRVFGNYAGGFIPRILKDVDLMQNPKINTYKTLWERLAKEVPVARRFEGKALLDVFAKQVAPSRLPWSRELVLQPPELEYQKLGQWNNNGIWLSPPNAQNRMVGKGRHRRPMTEMEADRYIDIVGNGYRDMVLKYGDRVLSMPKERAKAFVSDKADEIRDRAAKKAVRTGLTSG